MKIAEYNEMMAYLTRPEPLPQPKPQELLDLQEQKRKDRLRKTMDELDPVLMDESVDFIRRNQLAFGSRDKPKRGLVDEPGKYAGAADVRAFLKNAKKGSTIDVAKFLDEFAETQAERNQLNADFKRIVKEFKNKNLKLKVGGTGRKLSLEGKTGQIVEALQDLPKGSQIDLLQLTDDLELGKDGSSLIKKIIKNRKELQGKNFKAVTRTDRTIKKVNDFIEDYVKTNDRLPTQGEIRRGAKVDSLVLTRLIDEGEVQRIANTAFQQNKLAAEYILNTKNPTLKGLEKIIGDTGIGASTRGDRNIPRSAQSLATKVYVNSLRSLTNKLTKTDEGRSVYKNFSVNDVENIKNKIRKIPGFNSIYEREITDLVADAYKNDEAKKTKALKKIAKFKKINKSLSKQFGVNMVLDHPLSFDFINKATQGVDPEELIRVRPLPERVNAFKVFLDERVPIITEGLKKNPGSKEFISMRDDVVSIADELKIPFPKISNKGTIISPAAAKIGDKPISEDVRRAGQIQNAFRKFVQNISNDPRVQRLNINIDKLKDLSKLPKVNLKAYDKAVMNFLDKTGKFGLMIGAPYIAATRGPEFLRELGIVDRDFEQTAAVGDAPIVEEESSLGEKIGAGAGLTTGAAIGSKATATDPLKGLRRFGKEKAKNLLKTIFKTAGAPTVSAGFAASEILDYKKPEDASVLDRLDPRNYEVQEDPNVKLAGASLLAPEILGTLSSVGEKGALSKARSILMNPFGKAARAFTPVGLATIGAGAAYDLYKEFERRQALTDEERLEEDIERDTAAAEMMVGAAEGGRIGFADGSKDRKRKALYKVPRLGKILSGLDYLIDLLNKKTITVKRGESGTKGASSSFSDPDYKGKYFTPEGGGFGTAAEDARYYSKLGGDEANPKVFTAELTPDEIEEGLRLRALDSQDPEIGDIILPDSAKDKVKIDYLNTIRAQLEKYLKMAEGGRIGFASGPDDPKRRNFLKLMGGLASLPVLGKFFKVGEKAAPIVQQLKNTSTTMPEWFPDFVNKITFGGFGKKIDADITLYEPKELPGIEVYKHDDGKVFVSGKNEYGKSYEIEYEPPGYELIDETTGKAVKRKGEFIAQEEVPVNVDPDGNADFDVEVLEDLDQLLGSDTRVMEEFATGKKIKEMKSGEYNVGQAEARAEQAADEAAELEVFDEID
mgnify:CR=1 FL=1